ncbi:MAG TPA: hypothetical protein ENJ64_01870, partial [Thiotrichales bacterium]|nr:hypothetical protein [Thiotrichales bacterium]
MIHSHRLPSYCLFSACLLLLPVALVRAQQDGRADVVQPHETKLRVLIDDGRIEQRIGEVDKKRTSTAYSSIDAERFRHSLVELPEVLEQEVGVQVRSTGGAGSLSTVVLRGASAEQVIVYLDGVPLNDASGSPMDLSLIPLSTVERIDVYRGSTPLELGNPSIGGAINIITRQAGETSSQTTASLSAGSFQTYRFSGSASVSKAADDFLFSGSYLQSDNDFSFVNDNGTPANPADDRREKRNNDGVKHFALLGNWKHTISQRYDTELRLDLSDRRKELPGVTNSPDVQTYIDTRQYNLLAQLNAHSLWLAALDVNARLFASRKNEVFDDSLAQLGFINQRSESVTRKAGAQLFVQYTTPSSVWKLQNLFGLERYDRDSTQARLNSDTNKRQRLELSAENSRYFDDNRFIVNLALRYQHINDAFASATDTGGTVTPGFDKSYRFVNPQLGLKYRFSQHTFASANIGQYSRAPSFLELFGGDGLLLGNPDLTRETSLNSDLGFTYTWFKPYHWLHDAELYL